jgi:hypothetical protein
MSLAILRKPVRNWIRLGGCSAKQTLRGRCLFFRMYGNGTCALAAAEQQLGNYAAARADGMNALAAWPVGEERSIALDTVILATTNVRAGELREGVAQAAQALVLVQRVGSRRVRARLKPLAEALATRNDSTCRDLARAARKLTVA